MSTIQSGMTDLFRNMSNAFVGTIAEFGDDGKRERDTETDATMHSLFKENRYMYLALLVLLLMIVANLFFD